MKLISMTDFVLDKQRFKEDSDTAIFKVTNYAKFLKQPLELWMFVPCDENGNVLEKPNAGMFGYDHVYNNYNKAKDRVLFEGFEYDNKMEYWHNKHISFDEEFCENKTIEDLIQYNLTLYQTAIKQL